ncbi:P22 phage major capsid protein family protein [Rhodococcus sp. Chr-9]|uniref:P22 phage major capsid protein family protein n=1 Tax=Rhodococcus sp. Chr-9 TaxID=713612 RepID=UPI00068D3B3C|nr:P22 phage major capsid protein family protein [Rhodococcus sp. Chr-9]
MANTILKAGQIVQAGLAVLERDVVLPGIVESSASQHFSGRSPANDTVSLRINGRTVAKDYAWRDHTAAIELSDLNEFKIDVKLDTHPYNAIALTDEELTLDLLDFTNQVIVPQTRSVAERIEDKIAAKISGASYPVGSNIEISGSGGSLDFHAAAVDGRKVLNDYHVPQSDRVFLVGTGIEAMILKSDQFRKADQSGDANALRSATIGSVAGMPVVVSQSIGQYEGFVMHKSAFQTAYRVPASPLGGVDSASGSYAGIALRWLRDYDSSHLTNRSIFDTFFGISVVVDPDDYTDPDSTKSFKRAVKLTLGTNTYAVNLGGATGGTFTLTFNGRTTGNINYNATAATVKTALVNLDDGFAAADFTVTGSGGEFTIALPGSLTVDGASLTGGTGATVTAA